MANGSVLRLGLCQYSPRVGEMDLNRELGSKWIRRAGDQEADLVILPELAASGYTFQSEDEAAACSEEAMGPALLEWSDLCRERDLYVVCGFSERAQGKRFNSAALIGPRGVIGVYRKAHLFNDEKSYFSPGDNGFPVFDLPFGRVGMLICYDLWFPEAARVLTLRGADLLCVPTNWVANFRREPADQRGWTMGDYACVGLATQNQVFVAAADRIGEERGVRFVGCSCLVGPDGIMMAGPAPVDEEALLVAEVDLSRARRARSRTPRNDTIRDRRPELYSEIVAGSDPAAL